MAYYNNLIIYYFSGTGNALTAAKWIKKNGINSQMRVSLYSIEKIKGKIQIPESEGKTLIGFCYPTHGFFVPWIMLKFMIAFPKINNTDVFFLNTRGGAMLYKIFLPGLSGIAQWFPVFLFKFRGFGIKALLPLDMPVSWTSFCPPVNKAGINAIIKRCNKMVNKMCLRMFNGKTYFNYSIWISLPLDIALIPISFLYVLAGRFMLAKTLFSSYKCNNCRICELNCPVQAIVIKHNRPFWKYNCESCMRCMNICPQKSIQSWVTRISLIVYLLMVAGLTIFSINKFIMLFIVSFSIFPIYWIISWLLKIKLLNAIFTFSSLTKYWKRYINPEVKISDFKCQTDN